MAIWMPPKSSSTTGNSSTQVSAAPPPSPRSSVHQVRTSGAGDLPVIPTPWTAGRRSEPLRRRPSTAGGRPARCPDLSSSPVHQPSLPSAAAIATPTPVTTAPTARTPPTASSTVVSALPPPSPRSSLCSSATRTRSRLSIDSNATLVLTAGLPMLSDRARCRVPDSAAASPAIMVTNIFWKRLITGPPFRFLAEAVDEQPMWDMSADQLHQGRVQQEHERGEGQDHFRDGEPGRCRCRGLLFLGLQLVAEGLRPGHQRAVDARPGDTGSVRDRRQIRQLVDAQLGGQPGEPCPFVGSAS